MSLSILLSCSKKTEETHKTLNEKLNFDYSEYAIVFKNQFTSIDGYIIQKDSTIQYYDSLKYFYALRDFQPLFIKSFEDNQFVYSIIPIIEKADEHGLNPEQYHLSRIIDEFSKATDTIPNNSRYYQLAMSELLLSDAILKYSKHLRYGIINPKIVFPDSYFLPYNDSSKGDLLQPLNQEDIPQYLNDIQPKSKRYKSLQNALQYYKYFKNISWEKIPIPEKKIEIGSRNSLVNLIVTRLITLDYLDTSRVEVRDFSAYDSTIVKCVKKFQANNGLIDDGVIGKNTIERLNVSPEEYIEKIKINLERFRWNDYPDTSQYIVVNIPDFNLFVVDKGEIIFKSKVCTGSKRSSNFQDRLEKYKKTKQWHDKPEDWETPNMYGKISYIVLNPTWNVPQSIMREEIVYKMKRDSSYLSSHNFKVFLDTTEINPDSIKISDLQVEDIPYKIIQDPGVGNALGKLKFIFNNRFGIYLHDTPNRPSFNQSNRAVSHGCIRVERPIPLAEFLLKGHPRWNIDFLKLEIGMPAVNDSVVTEYQRKRESLRKFSSLGETTDIMMINKVPIYIDYYTAWVDDSGVINFRDDVYDRDKILEKYFEILN